MKHLAKFAAMALALGLWSCSDDLPDQQKAENNGDFYAKITIQLPSATGSRSETEVPGTNLPGQSSDGFEYGKDNENEVANILVILATKNSADGQDDSFTYLTSAYDHATANTSKIDNRPSYLLTFDSEQVLDHAGEDIYVFAICNPSEELIADPASCFGGKSIMSIGADASGMPIRNDISKAGQFTMSNGLLYSFNQTVEQLSAHKSPDKALDLGPVYVERLACRFDFESYKNNTYTISHDGVDYAQVVLDGMALFNESKNFYLFPHLQAAGLNGNVNKAAPVQIAVPETPTNFVVSSNWYVDAITNFGNTSDLSEYFNAPTAVNGGVAPSAFSYTMPDEIDDNKDNDFSSNQTSPWPSEGTNYYIWRYATENTIPTIDLQQNGISTGIYFRAKLAPLPSEEVTGLAESIKNAIEKRQPIFAFSDSRETPQGNTVPLNVVLGSLSDVWTYCSENQTSTVAEKFIQACLDGVLSISAKTGELTADNFWDNANPETLTFGTLKFPNDINGATGVAGATPNATLKKYDFYCWYPENDGTYYTYYPYYNRHWDNGDNNVMGQMEFATVRNNIYKIKVNNITRIGLPGDLPPDPDTPDEGFEVYFRVNVTVLDWVVRINNIDF